MSSNHSKLPVHTDHSVKQENQRLENLHFLTQTLRPGRLCARELFGCSQIFWELGVFLPQLFKLRAEERGRAAWANFEDSNSERHQIFLIAASTSYLGLQLPPGALELLQWSLGLQLLLHQSTFLFCHLLQRLGCFARSLSGLNDGSTAGEDWDAAFKTRQWGRFTSSTQPTINQNSGDAGVTTTITQMTHLSDDVNATILKIHLFIHVIKVQDIKVWKWRMKSPQVKLWWLKHLPAVNHWWYSGWFKEFKRKSKSWKILKLSTSCGPRTDSNTRHY